MADDDESSEEEIIDIPKRLKAATESKNTLFERSLRQRQISGVTNFEQMNKYKLQEMSQGINPPKARVDIPEGFEVHMYANQRKNIWEIQKDQMRKVVANDKEHFYTYSKDNLSGSFPLVNETEARLRAKQESEARWLNKRGFDKLGKRTNWNEHPKKPDPAKMDDLRMTLNSGQGQAVAD